MNATNEFVNTVLKSVLEAAKEQKISSTLVEVNVAPGHIEIVRVTVMRASVECILDGKKVE